MNSKKVRIKEYQDKVIEGVLRIIREGKLQDFIKFSCSFKGYSFKNIILIYLQKPDASYVAGIKEWNKLGRKVNKGEKGILIYAPLIKETEKVDMNDNGEVTIKKNQKHMWFSQSICFRYFSNFWPGIVPGSQNGK